MFLSSRKASFETVNSRICVCAASRPSPSTTSSLGSYVGECIVTRVFKRGSRATVRVEDEQEVQQVSADSERFTSLLTS